MQPRHQLQAGEIAGVIMFKIMACISEINHISMG